ncbi:MAG: hypothetical protein KGI28_02215 [Thaumarchaeota archaeon]|nr:hypothetical protein [Nitrososphaerota archaeon]
MKILLSLLIIPILVFSGYQAFGQQLSMGQAPHEVLKVFIDETGTAHVLHVVNNTNYSLAPIQVDLINGNVTNLNITDTSGNPIQYGKMMNNPPAIILNTSQLNATLVKYDIVNAVTNNDGVWKWNYYEPRDADFTAFYFPQGVDTVWANDRPVYLGNLGLGQHGNGFTLKYVINEPVTAQNVQWNNNNFIVGVRSLAQPGQYVFDQSQKTYAFSINKANVPITVIMPEVLLGGPYDVTLDGKPTLHQVFHNNGTHAWIGLDPEKSSGTILITGTTLGQEPQSTSQEQQATITPEQQAPSSASSNDMTIPILIIGIIVAGVAGLIIIKKRRTKVIKS